MADQTLSIFEDEPAVSEEPVQEPVQDSSDDAQAQPEPVEAEASETGEPDATPPVADPEPEPTTVPITAILDEREKRQAAEREAKELRDWKAKLEREQQAAQQRQVQDTDFFDNPQAVLQQQFLNMKLEQSRFLAEQAHGADLVAEAHAYFDKHPEQSQALLSHPSPFHAAVDHYKRQKFLEEVGADPEAWRAKQLEELKAQLAAETPAAPSSPTPAAPPASLSSAGASGKTNVSAVKVPARLDGLFNG